MKLNHGAAYFWIKCYSSIWIALNESMWKCPKNEKMYFFLSSSHTCFFLFVFCLFFLLEFIPCKTEQSIQGIELQEKEGQKD